MPFSANLFMFHGVLAMLTAQHVPAAEAAQAAKSAATLLPASVVGTHAALLAAVLHTLP
jgi:hypothetical protein